MKQVESAGPCYRELTGGQALGLFAAWLGLFLDGMDFSLMIYVVTDLAKEFQLSLPTASGLVGAAFTTRWIAGPVIGSISDRYGRRGGMIASVCLYTFGTAACGLAVGYWSLLMFRGVVGIGMAGIYSSAAPYIVEVAPARMRNTATSMMLASYALGTVAAAQIFPLIVPTYGWRALMFVGLAPAVIELGILFAIPESRAWMQSRSNVQQAKPSGVQVFAGGWWLVTVALCVAVFALYLGTMPVLILLPTYLKGIGYAPAGIGAIMSFAGIGGAIGAIVTGGLADRFGTARIICLAQALAMLLIIPVFLIGKEPLFVIGGLMLLLMMLTLGMGGILPKWVTEHYPVATRGAGVGTTYNVGAFGGFFGPAVAAFFAAKWGLAPAIVGTSIIFMCALILIVGLDIPERLRRDRQGTAPAAPSGAVAGAIAGLTRNE